MAAVLYLTARKGTALRKLDVSWVATKKALTDVSTFHASLLSFDREGAPTYTHPVAPPRPNRPRHTTPRT